MISCPPLSPIEGHNLAGVILRPCVRRPIGAADALAERADSHRKAADAARNGELDKHPLIVNRPEAGPFVDLLNKFSRHTHTLHGSERVARTGKLITWGKFAQATDVTSSVLTI